MKSLILADIHGNLPALQAVFDHERSWDEVIFLGDAIVAGPQPDEVVDRLREMAGNGVWIVGNHDLEPFHREVSTDTRDPDGLYLIWTRDQISDANRRFLESFERTMSIERQGLSLRLHHGDWYQRPGWIWCSESPWLLRLLARAYRKAFLPRWSSRIWPDTSESNLESIAKAYPEKYILFGHTHVQFRLEVNGTVFINPGAVGQPRLGQPLALYAVIENGEVELKGVSYDTEATCRALDRLSLDTDFLNDWKEAYRTGRVPDRYNIRGGEWQSLIDAGYR